MVVDTGIRDSCSMELISLQGWLRIRMGDLRGAVESYETLLETFSGGREIHRILAGLYHKLGNTDRAMDHLAMFNKEKQSADIDKR